MSLRLLIRESLLILNVSGVNPDNFTDWSLIRCIFCAVVLGVLEIELAFKFVFGWKGLDSVEDVAIFLSLAQIGCKFAVIVAHRQRFLRLFTSMEEFWLVTEDDVEITKEMYSFIKRNVKFMVAIVAAIQILFYSKPLLTKSRALPVETYHPLDRHENLVSYLVAYFLQTLIAPVVDPIIVGFDLLFISLASNIIWELRSLKLRLKSFLVDESNLYELYHLIDHHSIALKCVKDMDNIYQIVLLNIYVFNMFCICVGLLCISASGFPPNLQILSKYSLYVIFFVAQLFFYCLAGTLLTAESAGVSDVIYETSWWRKTQPKLRGAYVLMIQRGNKAERLTAGGMLGLDLETFSSVLKTAMSFFTLVQASYREME